jgi:hypothetical protein
MKQFRDKLFPQGHPMYFIYKSDEGCYLKWEDIYLINCNLTSSYKYSYI